MSFASLSGIIKGQRTLIKVKKNYQWLSILPFFIILLHEPKVLNL